MLIKVNVMWYLAIKRISNSITQYMKLEPCHWTPNQTSHCTGQVHIMAAISCLILEHLSLQVDHLRSSTLMLALHCTHARVERVLSHVQNTAPACVFGPSNGHTQTQTNPAAHYCGLQRGEPSTSIYKLANASHALQHGTRAVRINKLLTLLNHLNWLAGDALHCGPTIHTYIVVSNTRVWHASLQIHPKFHTTHTQQSCVCHVAHTHKAAETKTAEHVLVSHLPASWRTARRSSASWTPDAWMLHRPALPISASIFAPCTDNATSVLHSKWTRSLLIVRRPPFLTLPANTRVWLLVCGHGTWTWTGKKKMKAVLCGIVMKDVSFCRHFCNNFSAEQILCNDEHLWNTVLSIKRILVVPWSKF